MSHFAWNIYFYPRIFSELQDFPAMSCRLLDMSFWGRSTLPWFMVFKSFGVLAFGVAAWFLALVVKCWAVDFMGTSCASRKTTPTAFVFQSFIRKRQWEARAQTRENKSVESESEFVLCLSVCLSGSAYINLSLSLSSWSLSLSLPSTTCLSFHVRMCHFLSSQHCHWYHVVPVHGWLFNNSRLMMIKWCNSYFFGNWGSLPSMQTMTHDVVFSPRCIHGWLLR